ncbi:MAG: bifunctional diaminohydroxyphosphoribosylaminopyrimidine deaminase/5-amino-6-(5-phosphoribosylamino)uracil reductase RibD [Tepidisphaera sp.]|nr:bifunctional diaminohydroxyphosphoribosylaminopyrimidine deaminase/5-amino-6-(5-phosphoribosylamino)uracil reductase RibD [Tepidisphaera sp.]
MSDPASPASDARWLNLAARAALRAFGHVEPNPLVGAALVRDGRLLALAHHRRFGEPHAEPLAIAAARAAGHDPRGSTLYVTLEPCAKQGRNPPCTDAIIAAGIRDVVYAAADPNPLKSGGSPLLTAANIPARLSLASPLATALSAPFIKRITTGLPWVIAKWAQTIDGRIATRTGHSKWISNAWARRRVHLLRGRVDAILTGMGTVLADDPLLTPRDVPIRRPALRVIADSELDLPLTSNLVRTARHTPVAVLYDAAFESTSILSAKRDALLAAGVTLLPVPASPNGRGIDLRAGLRLLHERHHVSTIMVEAGAGLLGSLFEHNLVDEARVYIAPMLLGDELAKSAATGRVAESLSSATALTLHHIASRNGDVELTYRTRS